LFPRQHHPSAVAACWAIGAGATALSESGSHVVPAANRAGPTRQSTATTSLPRENTPPIMDPSSVRRGATKSSPQLVPLGRTTGDSRVDPAALPNASCAWIPEIQHGARPVGRQRSWGQSGRLVRRASSGARLQRWLGGMVPFRFISGGGLTRPASSALRSVAAISLASCRSTRSTRRRRAHTRCARRTRPRGRTAGRCRGSSRRPGSRAPY
jgi:hypothetical protein